MKKGFFRQKIDAVLGIDISDTAIRLVELEASGGAYAVRAYAWQPLPAQAVVDGVIIDLEGVGQVLGSGLVRARTRLKSAAVAVAGASVITRVVEMDAGFDDDEMLRRIYLEAERYVPYPLEEMALDAQVQGPSAAGPQRVDVLLAACRREQVEAREAVLALAGLVARVVDVEAFALARAHRQDFASFTPGHRVDGAQWAADAQGMGVACGLALRSFD